MSTPTRHLTRPRVPGAFATGAATTGAAVAAGTGLLASAPRFRTGLDSSWVVDPHTQPSTHSLTTGPYRGNNLTSAFSVPSSA